MKKRVLFLFIFALMFSFTLSASAETYKVAVMKTAGLEMYKKLFAALGEATNNNFELEVVPPARATKMIEDKVVDMQVPKIKGKDDSHNRSLKFDFADTTFGNTVAFVLYTNKNKPIDINDLKNGNKKGYKIETDGANLKQFGFKTIFSNNADQSLKKLAAGRIDGYLNSQNTGDKALKNLKLKNIHRQFWDNFNVSFTLQKGQAGGKLDKILENGINKLKASGKLEQIVGDANRQGQFKNWQP